MYQSEVPNIPQALRVVSVAASSVFVAKMWLLTDEYQEDAHWKMIEICLTNAAATSVSNSKV